MRSRRPGSPSTTRRREDRGREYPGSVEPDTTSGGQPRALVESEPDKVREWAIETYESYAADARPPFPE